MNQPLLQVQDVLRASGKRLGTELSLSGFVRVQVGEGQGTEKFGISNFPIAAHLSRSQPPPKFSNRKEDWTNFLWKFDAWVKAISAGKKSE